ncbi:hypothetical protein ACLMJK_004254 [Lecanora helva]
MDAPPAYPDIEPSGDSSQERVGPQISLSFHDNRHPTQGGYAASRNASSSDPARFHITLFQRNLYKSGDTISGSLNLTSERTGGEDIAVGSISISIIGRCTTTRPSRVNSNLRNSLQFFTKKLVLFNGPSKLHAASVGQCPSFPFTFTFPSTCDLSGAEDFETSPFFNSKPNQSLPGSFVDATYADKAVVAYELKADLLAPDFKGYYAHGSFSQTCVLSVYAPRVMEEPSVKFAACRKSFTHQSLDLLRPDERKYHERPLTLGQKLGIRSIPTDRQPKASFTATLLLPSVAVVGQALPLMLHIDHELARSTIAKPPIVHLAKIQIFLRTETSICGMKRKSVRGESDQTGWTTTTQLAEKDFSDHLPEVNYLDLRTLIDLTLDASLTPSFKAFNVARTYSVRAVGTIKCAGKCFAIWTDMERCVLLSKYYEPRLPGYNDPPVLLDGDEDQQVDEGPSPYENYVQLDVPLHQSIAHDREQHYRSRSRSPNHGLVAN